MASIPAVTSLGAKTDVRLTEIPGMVPSLTNLPKGCAFAPRCELAIERCRERVSAAARHSATSSGGVLARGGNGGAAMTDARPLLEVTDLVKHYPVRGGILRRARRHRACGRRRQLHARRRRNARPCRRIRLRQIDGGAQRAAAGRADQRQHQAQRRRYHPPQQGRAAAACAARCRSSFRTRSLRSIRA